MTCRDPSSSLRGYLTTDEALTRIDSDVDGQLTADKSSIKVGLSSAYLRRDSLVSVRGQTHPVVHCLEFDGKAETLRHVFVIVSF